MHVCIIGTGYVGLVTGACLSDIGHSVVCIDTDARKVALLNGGQVPLYEPGLDELVARNTRAGLLSFAADLTDAVAQADVVFIAVGTPSRKADGNADLSHVYAAAAAIARAVVGPTVVVIKSTVPVGTGDVIERVIGEVNPQARVQVVSNPEFLKQGNAVEDFRHPNRIVIGFDRDAALERMLELYRPLQLGRDAFVLTGRRSAELIKYASNAFLAMKITFINEMADLCEKAGGDIVDVARGLGLDDRIGAKFLNPGPGFGGSCFPKDTLALAKTAQDFDSPMRLVEATIAINDQRKRAIGRKIIAACGGNVRGKTIGILGLTFKPNTDDMRDAPSLAIILALLDAGAHVRAYDPAGMATARTLLPDITLAQDAYDAARGAHCVVLVTEWEAFRGLDLAQVGNVMAGNDLVDLRNIYRRAAVEACGLNYTSIGQPASLKEEQAIAAE